jgi:hypothetical protein
MLRNGQMLEGHIVRVAERYEIVRPTGELHVNASQVLFHCATLEEVYQLRRRGLQGNSAQEHIDLAQWCIQVRLFNEAREELSEAAQIDNRHPLLPVTERRLNMALVPKAARDSTSPKQPAGPTTQELDRLVRSMPPKTVETFTQSIQPLLVNQCGTAGCHGYGARRGFQLIRAPSDGPPTARATQRNLHATLQWLDLKSPDKSLLLTKSTTPHGSSLTPVFGDRQTVQYRALVSWCYRVAQLKAPVVPVAHEEPIDPDAAAAATAAAPAMPRRGTAKNASRRELDSADADLDSSARSLPPERTASRGNRRSANVPAAKPQTDPLDPEIFNRAFAPKRPKRDESGLEDDPAADRGETSRPSRAAPDSDAPPPRSLPRSAHREQRIPAEGEP